MNDAGQRPKIEDPKNYLGLIENEDRRIDEAGCQQRRDSAY